MSMQAETCGGENWTWGGEDVCVCVVTHSVNLCVFGLGGVTSSSAPLRPAACLFLQKHHTR